MPNVSEILRDASEVLRAADIKEPRRDAASLLAFALGRDRTFLIAHTEYELSETEEKLFREILRRRAGREPLQHITGRQEFYGLDFEVSSDVLIPRPETEAIVEAAVEILRASQNPRFCEVGVGSGCISVSILREVETAAACGLDISEKAIEIARRNASRHRVSDRFELKISDVFENLENELFDLIVSNPPYISIGDFAGLEPEVRDFEPRFALTDERNGLSIIERIVVEAPRFLFPGGSLLLEIGFGQAESVREMFSPKIWRAIDLLPDLQGIPRTVRADRNMEPE